MKILVLGSGGREHAIIWKLKQSYLAEKIFCIPGNGGIYDDAFCFDNIKITDFIKIKDFIIDNKIDLVIIGPEQPLVNGIKDFLSDLEVPIFGPTKNQAFLEASKIFAKNFMKKYNIPTADFVFSDNYNEAKILLKDMFKKYPEGIVIKADGLALGKGVVVCDNLPQAEIVLYDMMVKKIFGDASSKVVIEKRLFGEELSLIAFCDGEEISLLIFSQDHKQLYDNDQGPNTGGMGAYAPCDFISKELEEKIKIQIIENFMKGIKDSGIGYCGIIYFGLLIENLNEINQQPYVLEFNCRFGDPETQVILPLLKNDLIEVMINTVEKKLKNTNLSFHNKYTCCVVLASNGYPLNYETNKEIKGLEEIKNYKNIIVFHAGTKKVGINYFTAGGRVLNIVGVADNLKEAIDTAYFGVDKIFFENKYFRKDIGFKALRKRYYSK